MKVNRPFAPGATRTPHPRLAPPTPSPRRRSLLPAMDPAAYREIRHDLEEFFRRLSEPYRRGN